MGTSTWIDTIDNITSNFISAFGHLNQDQLNWKPNPARWSIAQNIEHLIVVNQTYFDALDKLRKDNYDLHWLSRFPFMLNFFGRFILKSVQPDRRQKIKTFPLWEPSSSNIGSDIIERFVQHQEALKNVIRESSGLLEKGAIIASPASKVIVYKLEIAFEIIIAHEKRHLEQAKEVLAQFGK